MILGSGTSATSTPFWQGIVTTASPAISGLIGVLIGAFLTSHRETCQRRHLFAERQIREFYAPLLGIRTEIRALDEVQLKVSKAEDVVWRKECSRHRESPEALAKFSSERSTEFTADIEYNDRQFREVRLPAYRRMVTTFRDNLWLAEPTTQTYFPKLVESVELWGRWLQRTIPAEVMNRIDQQEKELQGFFDHLAEVHNALQTRLCKGKS